MNILTDPIDYPILDGGPGMVDSRAMYLRAMRDGKVGSFPNETPYYSHAAWYRWAKFPIMFPEELDTRGITYWKLRHDQPAMDFDPGKNRVSLFADEKSRQHEINLLT